MTVSKKKAEELRRLRHTSRVSTAEIIRRTGLDAAVVNQFFADEREAADPEAQQFDIPKTSKRILDSTVRPLNLDIPPAQRATVSQDGVITALLYGDTHVPHEDTRTMAIVREIAGLLKPSLICNMGDLADAYPLSRFDKDPQRIESLQDEIDMARIHLAQMRQASPDSRFVLLEGNHEDRLRRTLWSMDGQAAALNKLRVFQQSLTWPNLFGLDELGIEFVPYRGGGPQDFLPKFLLKHGSLVRPKSAYTAAGELLKYLHSGASGHTHRLGAHWHGPYVWIETGCTCSTTPEYAEHPDWQGGCVVLTFEEQTGAVNIEPVEIRNGLAMWRGNVLRS